MAWTIAPNPCHHEAAPTPPERPDGEPWPLIMVTPTGGHRVYAETWAELAGWLITAGYPALYTEAPDMAREHSRVLYALSEQSIAQSTLAVDLLHRDSAWWAMSEGEREVWASPGNGGTLAAVTGSRVWAWPLPITLMAAGWDADSETQPLPGYEGAIRWLLPETDEALVCSLAEAGVIEVFQWQGVDAEV